MYAHPIVFIAYADLHYDLDGALGRDSGCAILQATVRESASFLPELREGWSMGMGARTGVGMSMGEDGRVESEVRGSESRSDIRSDTRSESRSESRCESKSFTCVPQNHSRVLSLSLADVG